MVCVCDEKVEPPYNINRMNRNNTERRGFSLCCMCFRRRQNHENHSNANQENFTDPVDTKDEKQSVSTNDTDVKASDVSYNSRIQYVPVHPADVKNLNSYNLQDVSSTIGQTQLNSSIPDSLEEAIKMLDEQEKQHEQLRQRGHTLDPCLIEQSRNDLKDEPMMNTSQSTSGGSKLKHGISKFFENIKSRFTGESKSESKVKKTQKGGETGTESKAKSESHMATNETDGYRIANYRTPSVELILWKEELDKNNEFFDQGESSKKMAGTTMPYDTCESGTKLVHGDVKEDIPGKSAKLETRVEVMEDTTMYKDQTPKGLVIEPEAGIECGENVERKHATDQEKKNGVTSLANDDIQCEDLIDEFAVKFVNKIWRESCLELTSEIGKSLTQSEGRPIYLVDEDLLDVVALKCVKTCINEAQRELETEKAATYCIDKCISQVTKQFIWTEYF